MSILGNFGEWYRAWLRGDKRVAPQGVRGRVYEKKDPGQILASAKFKSDLRVSAVIDGKTGEHFTPEKWRARHG